MNLMDKVDNLILGGGMTYTFKAALGGHVGSSICEADKLDLALDIMRIAKEKGLIWYCPIRLSSPMVSAMMRIPNWLIP